MRLRYYLTSFLVLAVDRLTKFFIMQHMVEGESIAIAAPFLYLTYVRNTGAAFGLLKGRSQLLAVLALLGVGLAAWQWKGIISQSSRVKWGVSLALSGALGNMIDRFVYGAVVDFLDVRIWPIFNVADIAIVCGVILLFWEVLTHDRKE